jgi:hypothetical protein
MSTLDNPNEITTTNVSPWPTGTRFGLFAGLITIVVGLVFQLTGLVDVTDQDSPTNWIASLVNWAVMIGAIYMAVKQHRDKELGGYIDFGRAFMVGFIVSLLIAAISLIWAYVFFAFVEPELIAEIIDVTRERMIEEQGLSEEVVDQQMAMTKFIFNPLGMAVTGGISNLVIGLIISLVVAPILKNTPAGA